MNHTDENKILGTSDENIKIEEIRNKFSVPDLSYLINGEPAKPIVQHLNMVDTGFGMHPDEFTFSGATTPLMEESEQTEEITNTEENNTMTNNGEIESKLVETEPSKTVSILKEAKDRGKAKNKAANPNKLINETEHCSKLKRPIIEKMLYDLKSKALNLLMLMARVQDKYGIVNGVDYKHYMKLLEISHTTFYKCLNELSEKGFIKYEKELECKTSYKVTIIDNDFSHVKKSDHVSYLSLNIDMFSSPEFLKLPILKRKLLIWSQLNIGGTTSKFKKKGRTITREDLAKQLNVTAYHNLDKSIRELQTTGFYMGKKVECPKKKNKLKVEVVYDGGFMPTSRLVPNKTRKNSVAYLIEEINITKDAKPELDYYLENQLRLQAKINKVNVSDIDKSEIIRLGHQYKKLGSKQYLHYCMLSYDTFGTFEKKYVCKCCSNQLRDNKNRENAENKNMSLIV